MGRKALLLFGALLMVGALSIFALNIYGQSWTYLLIGALTYIFSVLEGKKIASLVHDSNALNRRSGRTFSVSGMIGIIMLFFIFLVLIMSLTMMLIFKVAGLMASVFGAGTATFLYATPALVGSYLLFRHIYDAEPHKLRSSWGRRMESSYTIPENMLKKGKDTAESSISRISSAFSGNRGQP